MHSDSFMRSVRALGAFVFSAALAGCFGTGDGPESIAGTPAPPPPPSLCDPATAQGDGAPFPIFFENLAAGYDFGMDAGFGGGATVVVENPVCSAENTTPQVARYQKFAAEPFGGSTLQLGTNVDFTPGAAFTVKVWSQRVVPFTFKFEDAISGDPALGIERIESHSGSAEWETLCFDFTGATAGFTTSSITLIFDNGVVGDADNDPDNWTFFLDAIEQVDVCPGAPTTTLPVDFEGDPASFQFANFAGGEADVIANPDQSGSNTTAQTARMRKFADQVFGGSTLSLAGNVDFTQGTAFTMQVWSPRVVPVLFKFEDAITGDPNAGIEATENHPGGSEWQELCFDFGVAANGFTSSAITFIFDGAVVGDAENDPTNWTFYFDEIQQVADCSGGGGTSAPPSIDFESGSFTINDFDGGMSMVGANPETAGLNPSAAALQLQKFPGATFGGSTLQLGGDIDFSNGEIYEVLVYSTRTVDLLFKLEGLNIEATLTHGGTGWELLCYDFSGQTTGTPSSAITFIFDNGTAGAADTDPDNWTFFVDDIEQVASCGGGGGTGALPVLDFESAAGGTGFTWTVFENDDNPGVAFIPNPDQSGINTSATVAEFTARAAGAEFAGAATDDLPTFTLDASTAIVKVKVWKTEISDVGIKYENATQGSTGEIKVANTVVNQWEELTFDFTPVIGNPENTDITRLVIFPDFQARAQQNVIYFDDLTIGDGAGGGGTSAPPSIDFETGSFTVNDFDGGSHSFGTNPDMGGLNPSTNVLQLQKFPGATFGGSTLLLGADIDFSNGEAYQVLVYSTRTVDVLFKLEGLNIEGTVTHGGTGWELLCYDFTGQTSGTPSSAITFIFDNGTVGAADTDPGNWTFYVDDIEQVASCGGAPTGVLPIDFEASPTSYAFGDFDGGVGDVVANPEVGADNGSAQVARMQKFAGATFGGTTLDLGGTFDLPAGSAFTMKVRATRAVPVLFKLENGPVGEVEVNHGGTGWEVLCFDFDGVAAGNGTSAITFIFDNGTAGAAATDPDNWTFYFDDIELVADCPTPPTTTLPVLDFESAAGGTGFTWTVFENDDNPGVAFIPNPDQSGINTSATVAEFTARAAGAEFAGAATDDLPTFTLDASTAIVKVKVWKTEISDVGIKYENATQGSTGEIKVANTVVNQWEELTFDFTPVIGNPVNTDITRLVIFPDFQARAQQNVIYFDDLTIGDGSGGGGVPMGELAINGSFESGDLTDWTVFLNDGTATVVSSDATDGTFSVNVVAVTLQNPVLKQDFLAAGTVTTGQTVNISFDMKGSAADGGVIFPELISEGAMGATGEILETIVAPTTDWTTYSYSPTAGADVTMGITFQLAVVCGGAATCSTDVFIDNVSVTLDGGT